VAMPPMATIEIAGVSSQQPSHDCRERNRTSAKEKVNVIWKKCPGKNSDTSDRGQNGQSVDPLFTVPLIAEDGAPLDSPHHDMVQRSRGIESRTARHARRIRASAEAVKQ
jgi:hypothetical protein